MAKAQKILKGEPEYLNQQKKVVLIRTIIFFAISLAVFLIGYWSTKTKANLLSVVAVFGLLPSSKSLVSFIMYARTPKYSETVLQDIQNAAGEVPALYHMYLTSYKENYPLNCIAIRGNNIMGYSEFDSCNATACEEHIKLIASQNSLKNLNIKIFKGSELKKYEERLHQLQNAEVSKKESQLLELMKDISL
ncbi:MAG: hypothetical protein IJO85_08840 [Lachnospiraceae bacterium]|nr:hypothetical protein [Lachnospiraceae bacterium]